MLGCATQNSVLHYTSLDLNVMAMYAAHTHVHIAVTARIESMSTHRNLTRNSASLSPAQ